MGGSDPTYSGFSAAQRLRRRGSLPPKLSNKSPRSVAGRVVGRKPNNLESLTTEEMALIPKVDPKQEKKVVSAADGHLPSLRIAGAIRFDPQDLVNWLKAKNGEALRSRRTSQRHSVAA